MYSYGGYPGYGSGGCYPVQSGCGCYPTQSSGYGAAIILVLFILLVIVIGSRNFLV